MCLPCKPCSTPGYRWCSPGFELTSTVEVTEQDLEAIRERSNPTAEYFYTNSLDWVRHWTSTFANDNGFHPWDSAAISWLLHPEYYEAEERSAYITSLDDKPALYCARPGSAEPSGVPVTYLAGFRGDGKRKFVRDVVTTVY